MVSQKKRDIFCVCCNKFRTTHFALLHLILSGTFEGKFQLEGKLCFLHVHEDKRGDKAPKEERGRQVCHDCVRDNIRRHELHEAAGKAQSHSIPSIPSTPPKKRGRKPMEQIKWSPKTKKNVMCKLKKLIKEAKVALKIEKEEEGVNDLEAFGKVALQYFNSLKKRSSAKRSFMKFANDKFSRPKLAKLLGVSTRAIKDSLKANDFILKFGYQPRVNSQKLSKEKIEKIQNWWLEVTHPLPHKATSFYNRKMKTFSQGPYYEQSDTDLNLITKSNFQERTGLKLSYNTIVKYKPKTVHMAKQKWCVCHYCTEGRNKIFELEVHRAKLHRNCQGCAKDDTCVVERQLAGEARLDLNELKEAVKEYREHKEIADHQAKKMREIKDKLVPGEALVIMDFAGRFIVQACLEMSQADYFARVGVPDLVVYVYYRDKKDGPIHTVCFDLLSKVKEKDDYSYVRSCWLHLLNNEPLFDSFKIIHVFSDGGPKHFKIRKTIFFFSLLNAYYPQTFIWHFFQSCHGKGPCDGHTGMLKMLVKREILRGECLQTDRDLYDLFCMKSKANTRFISIQREDKELDCTDFKQGIKKYFSYSFGRSPGFVFCREKTGDSNFVLQKISPLSPLEVWIPFHEKQVNREIPMELCLIFNGCSRFNLIN